MRARASGVPHPMPEASPVASAPAPPSPLAISPGLLCALLLRLRCCSEAEYTRVRPLRSFVCTWNVNGKIPAESIDGWLTAGLRGADALPDLYVVG